MQNIIKTKKQNNPEALEKKNKQSKRKGWERNDKRNLWD